MKTVVLALELAAGMLAMVIVLRGGVDLREHADEGRVTVKATKRLTPDAALAIVPGAPPAMSKKAAAAAPASKQSALMAELARAQNLKALYDALVNKADRTPEEGYALAEIMARCGKNISKIGIPNKPRLGGDDRRKQFVDSLSDKDPMRDQRIAAFDQVNHDPCAGLENMQATQAEVRALIAAAAAAGDPKARALQIAHDLTDQMRPDPRNPGPRSMQISDAQLDTLRRVLAADDPAAVTQAARVLQMSIANLAIRTGATEATLNGAAFNYAAEFIACDLGNPCGRDNPMMLESCAVNGNCAAADYREHVYFYNMSPATVQTMNEYYTQLQRARAGDWSYFNFSPGMSTRAAAYTKPR